MPPSAILLILVSACLHAFWNLIGKRSRPSSAYFLTASLASAVAFSPVLVIFHKTLLSIPPEVWGLLLLTGCAQALYYTALAGAYRSGDLSLAYPMVRALPVLLVAAASFLLGRGEAISSLGIAGMFLVAAGSLMMPVRQAGLLRALASQRLILALVVLAALGTTGYLLMDDMALRMLRQASNQPVYALGIPILYIEIETLAILLPLTLYVRLSPTERAAWRSVRRQFLRPAIFSGLVITTGYGLVLIAMTLARDVSYVTAFRQISIPIGALLGILALKEPAYPFKLAGTGIIFLGLVLVGLG
jgi:drug/metabolite transporter (DMT)-like permease